MYKLKGWGCVYAALVFSGPLYAMPQNSASPRAIHATEKNVSALVAPVARSKATDESAGAKLPIRRVVLYKTGVGYFEHLGHVQGDQSVRVDFTSGQLNDVLQSLTILDLNGGRIAGVSYNSEAPLSQRLGALRLPLEETTDASKFYGALRGARLEVRSGTTVATGRLLSVERKTRVSGGTTLEVDVITLVSDTGEVRSVELTPTVSVRLAEHEVNDEVGRYLGLLGSAREQDLRRMTIETAGSGDRQLYVSYISEVPVWKTTYRIVLPSKGGEDTLLQGWAIVDNTVGEDWSNVELSLVAGAPQSFIQPLSQPYYTRRPVIALPEIAQLAPQTHEAAMIYGSAGQLTGEVTDPSGADVAGVAVRVYGDRGNLVASATTNADGEYEIGNLSPGVYRVEFILAGFKSTSVNSVRVTQGQEQTQDVTLSVGAATESVTVGSSTESLALSGRNYTQLAQLAPGAVAGLPAGEVLDAARQAVQAVAQSLKLGDFFEYRLRDRITIRKNESAMVPIANEHLKAEKVSLWNPGLNSAQPLRAVWLTNSSVLTFDGGSFSVLDDEAFAGEGLTDAIKPGEKRLLSYAADVGVRVETKSESDPQRVTRVRIERGVMTQIRELRQTTSYVARDDDVSPRTLVIEHALRPGWKLFGDGPQPDETTATLERFRLPVGAKSTASLDVREFEPLESSVQVTNVTNDQITAFLEAGSINSEVETALRRIVAQKGVVAGFAGDVARRETEIKKIYDDQQRLRENLKALKGSAEEKALTLRYTKQLDDQEERLETLQREIADLQIKRDRAQTELNNMIESLKLDTTI